MSTFNEGPTLEQRAGDPSALVTRCELLMQIEQTQLCVGSAIKSLGENDGRLLELMTSLGVDMQTLKTAITHDLGKVVEEINNIKMASNVQSQSIMAIMEHLISLEQRIKTLEEQNVRR